MSTIKLVTLTDPRSPAAEAYRSLRTNLIFSSVERALATVLVTAAAAADGKTEVAANLAVTLAQAGNKTILVDADLRKPSLHSLWNLSNTRGLTTMLVDDKLLAAPPLNETGIPNLSILTSGELPPVPADLVSSQRMTDVIGLLKARASFVVFDGPPVLSASDASLLGVKLDGVLLVTRSGATRRDQLTQAHQTLERVRARVLGVVLTNAPREAREAYG
jgi:non-specific protein-tyrosine kinase